MLGVMLALMLSGTQAQAQVFDGGTVIALHKAGLGDAPIVAKINAMPCGYDTSVNALVAAKKAGLSDQIIVAMVERCSPAAPESAEAPRTVANQMSPVAPRGGTSRGMFALKAPRVAPSGKAREPEGLYLSNAEALTMLRPSGQTATKVVGNGSILFPYMAKLIVPRPTAQMVIAAAQPVFMFYFNPTDSRVSEFGGVGGSAAQSPNEFSLVRFRADGGNRQMTIGRIQPYVSVSGIDPKNTLPFTMTDLGDGVFRVEMTGALEPGEYGFVLIGQSERAKQTVYRVYDFTVKGISAGKP